MTVVSLNEAREARKAKEAEKAMNLAKIPRLVAAGAAQTPASTPPTRKVGDATQIPEPVGVDWPLLTELLETALHDLASSADGVIAMFAGNGNFDREALKRHLTESTHRAWKAYAMSRAAQAC